MGSGYAFVTSKLKTSGANDPDILLIRTNNLGDTTWVRKFGLAGNQADANDTPYSLYQTPDSGFVVLGSSDSFDIYRTDVQGNLLWKKSYDPGWQSSLGGTFNLGKAIDQNVLIPIQTSNASGIQVWVLKIDVNSGAVLSTIQLTDSPYPHLVSTILETSPGCYTLSGQWQNNNLSVPPPSFELFLLECDSSVILTDDEVSIFSNTTPVFPNPFSDRFHLSIDEKNGGDVLLEIYNVTGQRMYSATCTLNEGKITVDPGCIPTGTYLIHVTNKSGIKNYARVVKN